MKNPPYPIRRILVPSRKHYRNKVSVFFICVSISFFMWGLIKLSRLYEAPVRYRIQYQNLPSDKVLVSAGDTVLTLFIKARGLELYSRMFNPEKNVINVNLSSLRLSRQGRRYHGYLRTSRFLKDISAQLPQGNNLIGVEPDTLKFTFEQEYRKRVPVISNVSLTFADQFQLYDSITLSPDSVTLFGARSVLDTLYNVKTQPYKMRNLNSSRMLTLPLMRPFTRIPVTMSTDTVTAEIIVERFTEADVEIPLTNGAKEVNLRTFPDKVTLTCRVAFREYERLHPSLFSASVDYAEALKSGTNLADVTVTRQPSFAKVIRIEPEKVEFLILK